MLSSSQSMRHGVHASIVVFITLLFTALVTVAPTGASARASAMIGPTRAPAHAGAPPCTACTRTRSALQIHRASSSTQGAASTPFSSIMSGAVVTFTLSGYQPDFDPIDRVIIAAHLHSGAGAKDPPVPDTLVVLYLYLENFMPTTTPLLPDLLHPNQQARNLGGFLSGKASFIDASGRELYRGGVLAEVFLDNSVHMIVDVFRPAAAATGRSQRLTSTFTLYRNLSVKGTLDAKTVLSLSSGIPVHGTHFPSWQSVVSKLTVTKPVQYGLTDKHLLPPTPGLTGSRPITTPPGLAGSGTITASLGLTSSGAIVATPGLTGTNAPTTTVSVGASTPGPTDAVPTPLIVGGVMVVVVLTGLGAFLMRRRDNHGAPRNA